MQVPPLRSWQSVIIDAPLEIVWEYNSDLSRIADFHPRVDKVELIDGRSQRLGQAPAHPKRDHDQYQAVAADGGRDVGLAELLVAQRGRRG